MTATALFASLCLLMVAAAATTAAENNSKPLPPHLGPLLSDYVVKVHSLRAKANFLRGYLVRLAHTMHVKHSLTSVLSLSGC